MEFIKFPSIGHFRDLTKKISRSPERQTVEFSQTVKIHGTNAGISLSTDGTFGLQSRNRIISAESDNQGFATWCLQPSRRSILEQYLKNALKNYSDKDVGSPVVQVTMFGEFAGQGIASGVAVNQLPKSFYAFALFFTHEDGTVVKTSKIKDLNIANEGLFNVFLFDHKTVIIDFADPIKTQGAIDNIIKDTLSVEDECSVGKYFGISGTGEGVVLTSTCGQHCFKSKGEKHSVSKIKTLAPIDSYELLGITSFVDDALTENRLKQGIDYLNEMNIELDNKAIGSFIKWCQDDIMREEEDVIQVKKIDIRRVKNEIGKRAKKYLIDAINQ